MDKILLVRIAASVVSAVAIFSVAKLISVKASMVKGFKEHTRGRYLLFKKILSAGSIILLVIFLLFIWGINIKNLWLTVSGIFAMIAVAFFAVWSLIGNILAGILLYFTAPFRPDDTIEVLPEGIKGSVIMIDTFFTVIEDESGDIVSIPNALFFQRYVKKYAKKDC